MWEVLSSDGLFLAFYNMAETVITKHEKWYCVCFAAKQNQHSPLDSPSNLMHQETDGNVAVESWESSACVSSMTVSRFGLYLNIFRGSIRMKGNAITAFAWSVEVFSTCTIYFLHSMMGFLNICTWVLAHSGIYLCTVKRENEHNMQFGIADSLQWNRERISLRKSGGQPRSSSWCGGLSGSRWAGVFLGRYAW